MKDNNKIISVRPSPLASKVGIIVMFAFLIFGIFFMATVLDGTHGEEASLIMIFFVIWIIACVGGIIYNFKNLSTYSSDKKSKIPLTAAGVIEIASEDDKTEEKDFDAKLRKLESLRKEMLISEEEYKQKRKEIMREKW